MDVPRPLKRKDRDPSPRREDTADTSPTSLPSIRHFLPPQHPQDRYYHHPPPFPHQPQASSSARYSPRAEHPPPPPPPQQQQQQQTQQHSYAPSGFADSEPEDPESASRPKQKRRRQALSCTECKRRKIKCDRAHPCTPCIRRGDQNKCQWHVIEPIDKYVSRAEFDELKTRFDRLEAIVNRLPPAMPYPPPGFADAPPARASPAPPASPAYRPPSSASPPYPSPTLPPLRAPPLSLAALTAPYAPPKNAAAQTLTPLGERLRARPAHPGPAAPSLPPAPPSAAAA
ncbi:hypothetical protein BV25DRAFT_971788 [Artomyces pyxidatus]|uniref:Uncharacterized protein n=1 Tax=Artomyces pyxidatus TaxID=48021 RepID=A0ACB8SWP2_9AGAM|nr:hypothetical protein BV25DRAFT_971788 [Artomyces pyxidatus]